jgi:hypothetical protein
LEGSHLYLEFGVFRVYVLVCRRVGASVLNCSFERRLLRLDRLCEKMGGCFFRGRIRLVVRGAGRG